MFLKGVSNLLDVLQFTIVIFLIIKNNNLPFYNQHTKIFKYTEYLKEFNYIIKINKYYTKGKNK